MTHLSENTADMTPEDLMAEQVAKMIMNAVQAADELKLISIWLGQATSQKMSELTQIYLDHLAVLPEELHDLEALFSRHYGKFTTQDAVTPPERMSV